MNVHNVSKENQTQTPGKGSQLIGFSEANPSSNSMIIVK